MHKNAACLSKYLLADILKEHAAQEGFKTPAF
jgi:hypothetical protein